MRKGSILAIFLSVMSLGGVVYPGCGQRPIPDEDPVEALLPQVHYWNDSAFPLRVELDTNMETRTSERILIALEYWNAVVGAQVFDVVQADLNQHLDENGILEHPPYGVIYVQVRELGEISGKRHLLGLTQTNFSDIGFGTNELDSAIVWIDDDLTVTAEIIGVSIHEFGHSLGLTHDRDIDSIMYPYALESHGQIMDEDVRYIRNEMLVRSPF